MKLLGKNRDWSPDNASTGAIDRLLRAYISRPGNRACAEFDADLANAYIERSLTPASRSRYEQHLSECTPCRKNVTALSRLVEPLSRPMISADANSRSGAKRLFGVASWPRWAMATAAGIVLAISLPLVLTRNTDRPATEGSQAVAESARPDNTQAVNQPLEENKVLKQSPASSLASAEPAKPSEKRQVDAIAASGPAPTGQPPGVAGDRAASGGKLEAKPESKSVEQATVTGSAQPATELAAGQAKQEKKADKDEASRAREQQPSKDASAADAKANNKEQDQEKEKDKARLAENATAVPPPAAPGAKAGKLKRSPARLALRDSSAPESVRPTERKIGNKKFSLKNDTWTDKQFDPDKDLPVVTIIHSSNVYSELLSKQGGLKTYLGSFNPTERAIFEYKGTVYKLIPQQ